MNSYSNPKSLLKIGIVVFIGCIFIALLILFIEDIRFKRYNLIFYFNYIAGLEEGAAVRFCGMQAGQIRKICFEDNKIKVIADIDKSIKIPKDSKVTINALGLIGERYIEIIKGQSNEYLMPNQALEGIDPTMTEALFIKAERLLSKLSEGILGLEELLKTEKIEKIFELTENLAEITEGLKNLFDIFQNSLKDISSVCKHINSSFNKQKIQDIVDNISSFSQNLSKISQDFSITYQNLKNKFNTTLTLLIQTLKSLQGKDGVLGELLYNKDLKDKLAQSIEDLAILIEDIREHPWKLLLKEKEQKR